MAEKGKHPSWFKMKLERRELIRQLSSETAVNVILACLEYLETGERPEGLSPIENIAFSSFIPDMEEAWNRYLQRISSGAKGGRSKGDKNHTVPHGGNRYHTAPNGTEEEVEVETETEEEVEKESVVPQAAPAPTPSPGKKSHSRFVPPTLEEVTAFVRERVSPVDPQGFIDFYAAKGWMVGKNKMVDWKAACRNAEKWERWRRPDPRDDPRNRIKTAAEYESDSEFFKE